jgi:hypothetical protein
VILLTDIKLKENFGRLKTEFNETVDDSLIVPEPSTWDRFPSATVTRADGACLVKSERRLELPVI